jgi:hypothetical protein
MKHSLLTMLVCGACAAPHADDATNRPDAGTGADAALQIDAPLAIDAAAPTACGTDVLAAAWKDPEPGALPRTAAAPAIDIDAAGNEQIVFDEQDLGGADLLTWASRSSNGSWMTAAVGAAEASQATLVIDAAGRAHGCFVRARLGTSGPIDCVDRTPSGAPIPSQVDPMAGWAPSLALDPSGGLALAYVRADGIWLARRPSSMDWSTERVAAGSFASVALAIDASGGFHIAAIAVDGGDHDLVVMDGPPGSSWSARVLDTDSDTDALSAQSMTADSSGNVHLVFSSDYAGPELDYAEWSPAVGTWQIRRGIGFGPGKPTSFAITAPDLRVDVAYFAESPAGTPGEVHLARRNPNGDWTDALVARVQPVETDVSVAADPTGAAVVVYDDLSPASGMRSLHVATVCH